MYSRQHNREMRLPPNYGGSRFSPGKRELTPVQDLTKKAPVQPVREEIPVYETEEPQSAEEILEETCEEEAQDSVAVVPKEKRSVLSPLGNLGTEELLLLALALIIFQGGKEPDLALILIALLFIT